MNKVIEPSFFNQDTNIVAKKLLGKFLVRKIGNKKIAVMITETESYDGLSDKASHASKGRTKRTEVMFSHPGIFYVYLCYGMYYMLNVVTKEHDYPAAVLIRGGLFLEKEENGLAPLEIARARSVRFLTGPGKLTKFLNIGKTINSKKLGKSTKLWFEDRGVRISEKKVLATPRIGVHYAGPVWSRKKRRFVLFYKKAV